MVLSLTAFSLAREALYKTGSAQAALWPSPVQVLAVLSVLNHELNFVDKDISPLFEQLAAGEGKTAIEFFVAVLRWVSSGRGVAVIKHRDSVALRESLAFSPVLNALGIENKHLTENDYALAFTGFYYVEFNVLAAIRQLRLLELGNDLPPMHYVMDEGDEMLLHTQTDNNLTRTTGAEDVHPHAWVFEALAEYIEKFDARKESLFVNVAELVDFLSKVSPLGARAAHQVDFLVKLPDYLNAVWLASTLVPRVDYIVKPLQKERDTYYAAVLINGKPMPHNVTFNGLTHQGLHGLENHRARRAQSTRLFPIASETKLFSTMSPEAVVKWLTSTGRLTVLSATNGASSERMEMTQQFGLDFIKLPKKQSSLRVDYPLRFAPNAAAQLAAVTEVSAYYLGERTQHKSRSVLIVTEDIEMTLQFSKALAKFNPAVLHGDLDDISDESLSALERHLGQAGRMLIAVGGLVERAFDPKLVSSRQLVVIGTYLTNESQEVQVKSRGGRVNPRTGLRDKGKYYGIYDLEREAKRYPGIAINVKDIEINPEAFKQRQYFAHYQKEAALRLHRQLLNASKQVIQSHFFVLWQALFTNPLVVSEMRDKVIAIFTKALEDIANTAALDDFAANTERAKQSRSAYNRTLLQLYHDALTSIQGVAGNVLPDKVESIIAALSTTMGVEQERLIQLHARAIAIGTDVPAIKVHKQWKKGVKFNAYLDAGKQGNLNYMGGLFSALFQLTAEQKRQMQEQKKKLDQKVEQKKGKKTSFVDQLRKMMKNHGKADQFEEYVAIYEMLTEDQIDYTKAAPQSEVGEEAPFSVSKSLRAKTRLTFEHDPGIGKAYQISFVSDRVEEFDPFQSALTLVYDELKLEAPLKFSITQLRSDSTCYQVTFDFSGHDFDATNRQLIFSKIAAAFNVDVHSLLEKSFIPSMSVMTAMRTEFVRLLPGLEKSLPTGDAKVTRRAYCDTQVARMQEILRANYTRLDAAGKRFTDVLFHYASDWFYLNLAGENCRTSPPPVDSISGLYENHKKRFALDALKSQIDVLKRDPFAGTLLLRQQIECLVQFGMEIAKAPMSESLKSVYHKWKDSNVYYSLRDMPIHELLRLHSQKQNLFGQTTQSVNAWIVCEQIEALFESSLSNVLAFQ
jgi:hypothetical protein